MRGGGKARPVIIADDEPVVPLGRIVRLERGSPLFYPPVLLVSATSQLSLF